MLAKFLIQFFIKNFDFNFTIKPHSKTFWTLVVVNFFKDGVFKISVQSLLCKFTCNHHSKKHQFFLNNNIKIVNKNIINGNLKMHFFLTGVKGFNFSFEWKGWKYCMEKTNWIILLSKRRDLFITGVKNICNFAIMSVSVEIFELQFKLQQNLNKLSWLQIMYSLYFYQIINNFSLAKLLYFYRNL